MLQSSTAMMDSILFASAWHWLTLPILPWVLLSKLVADVQMKKNIAKQIRCNVKVGLDETFSPPGAIRCRIRSAWNLSDSVKHTGTKPAGQYWSNINQRNASLKSPWYPSGKSNISARKPGCTKQCPIINRSVTSTNKQGGKNAIQIIIQFPNINIFYNIYFLFYD